MSAISSLSGYSNAYQSYNNAQSSSNPTSNALQSFNLMQNMQMSMINAFSPDASNNSQSSDGSDILTSDFNAQLTKILTGLQNSLNQKFDKELSAVSNALDAKDIAGAKKAFNTFETQTNRLNPTSGQTQKDQDFAALKSALDAGDITSAKTALFAIQNHSSQARTLSLNNSNTNALSAMLQGGLSNANFIMPPSIK